jgi:hypothetical protein
MASKEEPMPTSSQPAFNPANFTPGQEIDNRYFPLDPGTTLVYHTFAADGSLEQIDTVKVTENTAKIDGVTCTVVSDIVRDPVTSQLIEKTKDYYAQDKKGNVWYFGEDTAEYENGKLVTTEGSWRAGVNGAQPGIIMEAHPKVGDSYDQENAPGVSQDHAKVIGRDGSVSVPYGHFHHVLVTFETTPLDPTDRSIKSYAAGVGDVLEKELQTGEVSKLVSLTTDDSAAKLAQSIAGFGTGGAPLHASPTAQASLADLHPALAPPHHA